MYEQSHPQQIYCSLECRTEASKESARRYARIAKYKARRGKTRLCKSCGTQLSVYNDHTLCSTCHIKISEVNKMLANIKGLMSNE